MRPQLPKPKKIRLRYNEDDTTRAINRLDKVLAKIGQVTKVRGYRYAGRYNTTHEAVMLYGTKGTARLSGYLWGYGGAGPCNLVRLLKTLGLDKTQAENIAFNTPRRDHCDVGNDWQLSFIPNFSQNRQLTLKECA